MIESGFPMPYEHVYKLLLLCCMNIVNYAPRVNLL